MWTRQNKTFQKKDKQGGITFRNFWCAEVRTKRRTHNLTYECKQKKKIQNHYLPQGAHIGRDALLVARTIESKIAIE